MPLNYNPTTAQQNAVAGVNKVAQQQVAYGQDNFLFASGHSDAYIESVLTYKFRNKMGRHFMHTFLQNFGTRSFPVAGQVHSWYEMGRTRTGATVASIVSGDGTATLQITTNDTVQKFLVNETLHSPRGGWYARISAVAAPNTLDLVKTDGTVWTVAADITVGDLLGNSSNIHAEGSGQPDGKVWNPTPKTNSLARVKTSYEATGDALTLMSELEVGEGKVWAYEDLWITCQEHKDSRENTLMWSQRSADDDPFMTPQGIVWDVIDNSASPTTYATLAETDLQAMILNQNVQHAGNDYLLAMGQNLYADTQNILRDYVVDGGVLYGEFASKEKMAVGLKIKQYDFMGKTLNFVNYQGFDDREITGYAGAASATVIDFRNFGLLLNLGEDGGKLDSLASGKQGQKTIPYISYMYKKAGSADRSLVYGFQHGMTGNGNSAMAGGVNDFAKADFSDFRVDTDLDVDKFHLLSQIGPRLVSVDNAHSYIRKNA